MRMHIAMVLVLLVVPLVIQGCPDATPTGATYYVAPDGSDSNPGTQAQPWRTISHAADAARAGDTVCVTGGTYQEHIVVTHSGTESAPIVLRNAPGASPVVRGDFRLEGVDYVHIIGFEITGPTAYWCAIYIKNGADHNLIEGNTIHHSEATNAVCIIASEHNTVRGNALSHCGTGVEIGGEPCRYNVIENNHVFEHTRDEGNSDGIHLYRYADHNAIIGNVMHDNSDDGLDTWGSNYNLIAGNTSYRNGYMPDGSVGGNGNGFKLGGGHESTGGGNLVINNIAYENRMMGLTTNSGPHPNTLYNNTAYGNYRGFEEWDGSGGSTFKNNIAYRNEAGEADISDECVLSHNLFSGDPLFVDATGADFHLRAGSPAIDMGATLTQYDVPSELLGGAPDSFRSEVLRQLGIDHDGEPRPQGRGYDIGAHEYVGGEPSVTPTVTDTPTQPPTATDTPAPTPEPTATPTPEPTVTPTDTPAPTLEPTPTDAPVPTSTPDPEWVVVVYGFETEQEAVKFARRFKNATIEQR